MRHTWIPILSAALWGCGARSELAVGAGGGNTGTDTSAGGSSVGGSTAGFIQPICYDCTALVSCSVADSGPGIVIVVAGSKRCGGAGTGVAFVVWGPDLQDLHAGSVLAVMPGVNAFTQGYRILPAGQARVSMTGGTLTFATYAAGQGSAGTYAVTFDDGSSAQGSFDAQWCPGDPWVPCG
jgi:hypothetical protein